LNRWPLTSLHLRGGVEIRVRLVGLARAQPEVRPVPMVAALGARRWGGIGGPRAYARLLE
jgi:hypothetical protein